MTKIEVSGIIAFSVFQVSSKQNVLRTSDSLGCNFSMHIYRYVWSGKAVRGLEQPLMKPDGQSFGVGIKHISVHVGYFGPAALG